MEPSKFQKHLQRRIYFLTRGTGLACGLAESLPYLLSPFYVIIKTQFINAADLLTA